MMNGMIKALPKKTIVFLLLVLATPVLVPVLYELQKLEIKKEMLGFLQKRKLQSLQLAARDVVWIDKHEIWVNEQMFDIATATLDNGVYTFTGLYDAGETLLVKKRMTAGNEDPGQQQRNHHVLKWLHTPALAEAVVPPFIISGSLPKYACITTKVFSRLKEVTTPPPRAFLHIDIS